MRTDHPLTLTVEQAGQVLGVGRSTAYELVRSGDLKCIRLRRRIVVPVAHLAESLGVDRESVWAALTPSAEGGASWTRVPSDASNAVGPHPTLF
jgi:excisionase family DNA binding protein